MNVAHNSIHTRTITNELCSLASRRPSIAALVSWTRLSLGCALVYIATASGLYQHAREGLPAVLAGCPLKSDNLSLWKVDAVGCKIEVDSVQRARDRDKRMFHVSNP